MPAGLPGACVRSSSRSDCRVSGQKRRRLRRRRSSPVYLWIKCLTGSSRCPLEFPASHRSGRGRRVAATLLFHSMCKFPSTAKCPISFHLPFQLPHRPKKASLLRLLACGLGCVGTVEATDRPVTSKSARCGASRPLFFHSESSLRKIPESSVRIHSPVVIDRSTESGEAE